MSLDQFRLKHPKLYKQAVNRGIEATVNVYSSRYIVTPKPETLTAKGPQVKPWFPSKLEF